jgi:hypothetical protein
MLSAFSNYAGFVQHAVVTFDPVAHRFWRMRETAGQVYWEVSPDRTTWTALFNQADAVDLSMTIPAVYAGTFTTSAAPGTARFDNAIAQ